MTDHAGAAPKLDEQTQEAGSPEPVKRKSRILLANLLIVLGLAAIGGMVYFSTAKSSRDKKDKEAQAATIAQIDERLKQLKDFTETSYYKYQRMKRYSSIGSALDDIEKWDKIANKAGGIERDAALSKRIEIEQFLADSAYGYGLSEQDVSLLRAKKIEQGLLDRVKQGQRTFEENAARIADQVKTVEKQATRLIELRRQCENLSAFRSKKDEINSEIKAMQTIQEGNTQ